MRTRLIVTGCLAVLALTAAKPNALVLSLLRAEGGRVTEVLNSLKRSGHHVVAPASAVSGAVDPCPAGGARQVKVSTAKELAAALAGAKPGDHIRMADGVYRGPFVLKLSGTADQPITLCGSRGAILDGGTIQSGYGLHLNRANHVQLLGFTARNASKGIMLDNSSHNLLRGLELHEIGDEAVHFRTFSSENVIRDSWIHDVGLDTPLFGEAVYIGSARSNWGQHSGGKPDACDRNQVLANVLGPEVRAEGVDAKEGTRGGVIAGNVFLGPGASAADSWIDLKCSDYRVEHNVGTYDPKRPFKGPVMVYASDGGWGTGNVIGEHRAVPAGSEDGGLPYRMARKGRRTVTLVLPRRSLPYGMNELAACFPQTVQTVAPGVLLVNEHVLAGPGTRLEIRREDVREIRLRSTEQAYATIIGVANHVTINGSDDGRVWIRSWDPQAQGPDRQSRDGRAFVTSIVGRMDVDLAEFSDLGYGTGWASGAAWKGRPGEKSTGNVSRSRFERNFFGAYTFEADSMRWTDNVFANNDIYGFDPHDNSDWFVVTGNQAFGNPRHGIIFSRGCRGNVVRKNASFSNRGHGIMFDDGKVIDDGNPRHSGPVAPVGNLIEDNEVWGNEVGIALQGCADHVVRGNRVRDNRFGVRLDQSDRNTITQNSVLRSKELAIQLIGGSDSNRITVNQIQNGQGAVITEDSRHNVIERNAISGIIGQGIRIVGRAGQVRIAGNQINGRGSRAIDVTQAQSAQILGEKGNATQGWMRPRETLPALVLWGMILGVPLTSSVLVRLRKVAFRHPRRTSAASAALMALLLLIGLMLAGDARADGQSLSMTASFSALRDDNTFKYSDTQIRDIQNGTTPYRYGVSQPGDLVMGPAVAIQWQNDMEGQRRRSFRLRADGAIYSENRGANFGEIEGTWRESFDNVRRLSFAYAYTPDRLLRKLYDADLTALPSTERYRDARYDAHGFLGAWRHEVPFANWLEWTYRFDRRIHDANFRERDSDFHVVQAGLGWQGVENPASLQLVGSHTWRLARAEDNDPEPEGDLSYHAPEVGVSGRLGLAPVGAGWFFGDAGYSVERRIHDSTRANDTNNGRKDVVQALELGLGIEQGNTWMARAFYRHGRCRADLASSVPLDSELGSYDQNQFGVSLEWTRLLQRQP